MFCFYSSAVVCGSVDAGSAGMLFMKVSSLVMRKGVSGSIMSSLSSLVMSTFALPAKARLMNFWSVFVLALGIFCGVVG